MTGKCWECDAIGDVHEHHPVPRSRGGTRTIPLCKSCHGKAHHRDKAMGTSALVRDALAVKAARGEKTGGVCIYGEAEGNDAERNAAERAILSRVRELHSAGLSIRAIAAELFAAGMRTRRGGEIQSTQVARILRRAAPVTSAAT